MGAPLELKVFRFPNPKMSLPSTKNGRFSGKKVSNADRFTTAGSTSTWPKSGFTVPVSVSPAGSPTRTSAPADCFQALER